MSGLSYLGLYTFLVSEHDCTVCLFLIVHSVYCCLDVNGACLEHYCGGSVGCMQTACSTLSTCNENADIRFKEDKVMSHTGLDSCVQGQLATLLNVKLQIEQTNISGNHNGMYTKYKTCTLDCSRIIRLECYKCPRPGWRSAH